MAREMGLAVANALSAGETARYRCISCGKLQWCTRDAIVSRYPCIGCGERFEDDCWVLALRIIDGGNWEFMESPEAP